MTLSRRSFIRTLGMLGCLSAASIKTYGFGKKNLPKILILGDSISIGYTPFVKELLSEKAEVLRPDGNCQGTTFGKANIDAWLGTTQWDVIHFNFGLHDLKHVDPITGKNSTNETDPQQANLRQYKKNLKEIVQKLKATNASLIFATTTPYPDQPDGPLRRAGDVLKYNKVAIKIMKRNKVAINDLYALVLPQMQQLQIPNNVHFEEVGNKALAQQVAESIEKILNT